MRRENSDFVTKFVTSAGDFKINKDYFAYIELDDYACWVLADGLDSATEKMSAEIVVNSILSNFSEEPSLKKRKIKNYIKQANQRLKEESRTMSLQSTVLVVVSDYHFVRWGYVGNTRLYHLRKEKIRSCTTDHSIAQMMLEVGDISKQQLNQHQERNNLNKYLGKDKSIKPKISKKVELADDDILVLCTSGFWENIMDQELKSDLAEIKGSQELVDNLETKMLSNTASNLDNYSIVSVFANKVLQEAVGKKKLPIKKIAMIIIPLLFLSGGVFMYNKRVSKIRAKVMAAKSKVNRANRLIKKGQGKKARPELEESKKSFKKLGKDKEVAKINKQLKLIDAQELEKKGDKEAETNKYVAALSKYKEAKMIYLKVGEYNLKEIEAKIFRINRILKGKDYQREGTESYNSGSYKEAKQKYNLALEIYRECKLSNQVAEVKNKLEKIDQKIAVNDQSKKVKQIKSEAKEYLQMGEYKKAINKYIEAKVICSNLGLTTEVTKINTKIERINKQFVLKQGQEYEDAAVIEFNKQNFSEALFNYQQAAKTYSKGGLANKVTKVKEKIASVETAKFLAEAENIEDLGDQQVNDEKYEAALSSYQEAKEIYDQVHKREDSKRVQEKIKQVKEKNKGFFKRLFS